MKRRITLSIALILGVVVLSLMRSDSTAKAQIFANDIFIPTGIVTPAAGQILRVTVLGTGGSDSIRARFKWAQYGVPVCGGTPAVCRHMVVSQGATPVVALGNDTLSFDVAGNGNGVNITVESNNRNVRVNAMIINAAGEVTALNNKGIDWGPDR